MALLPRVSALAAAILATVTVAGCREARKPDDGAAGTQRYTFRAEVVKLPEASHSRPQLTLRHEAIPDFRDQSGAVVGMPSMIMPFEVAPSTSLDGIGVGDKVEAVLLADWPHQAFRLERVRKLPGDTAIEFGPRPPAATPAGH